MIHPSGAVARAVREGRMSKPKECSRCGADSHIQAHHHKGYAPEHLLDVMWLCASCHRKEHIAHPELQHPLRGKVLRLLDTRIIMASPRDLALGQFITDQAHINRRTPSAQIIVMLTYAAAQMSAHDQENNGNG
jgi:hypothetical protein